MFDVDVDMSNFEIILVFNLVLVMSIFFDVWATKNKVNRILELMEEMVDRNND